MITGKAWGATEVMLSTPLVEIHWLRIEPNRRCSRHVHRRKWNAFIVLSGALYVEVWKNDYNLVDVTELRAGELMTVRPGEFHRFRTEGWACEALEIYYLDPLSDDIERIDCGGIADCAGGY